jgi:predicted alpha/beta hydrolase family esterase
VLCHSLACFLWMHHSLRRGIEPVARVLLVAPPSPHWREPAAATFLPPPYDPAALAAAAGETLLVCGDGDPYCPERADRAFPELQAEVVAGGGHLNADAGYGPWPWVEAWSRGA